MTLQSAGSIPAPSQSATAETAKCDPKRLRIAELISPLEVVMNATRAGIRFAVEGLLLTFPHAHFLPRDGGRTATLTCGGRTGDVEL